MLGKNIFYKEPLIANPISKSQFTTKEEHYNIKSGTQTRINIPIKIIQENKYMQLLGGIQMSLTLPLVQLISEEEIEKIGWIEDAKYRLIKQIDLEVDGKIISTVYGEYLKIYDDLNKYSKEKFLTTPAKILNEQSVCIPINFWGKEFNYLLINDITVNLIIYLNSIKDCIIKYPSHYIQCSSPYISTDEFSHILKDKENNRGKFIDFTIDQKLYYTQLTNKLFSKHIIINDKYFPTEDSIECKNKIIFDETIKITIYTAYIRYINSKPSYTIGKYQTICKHEETVMNLSTQIRIYVNNQACKYLLWYVKSNNSKYEDYDNSLIESIKLNDSTKNADYYSLIQQSIHNLNRNKNINMYSFVYCPFSYINLGNGMTTDFDLLVNFKESNVKIVIFYYLIDN